MSKKKGGRRPYTIRLDEETHALFDKAIESVTESDGLSGMSSRGDAVKIILHLFFLGAPENKIPRSNLKWRVDCHYLRRDHGLDAWVCDETVLKKRASTVLGNDNEVVLAMCSAHLRKIREIQDQKIQLIRAKKTVAKAIEFYKKFMTIAEDGFGAGCFICTAMHYEKGELRISDDNKTLYCHKLGKPVDIKTVCRENINTSTGVPPCESFFEFVHAVYFDDIEEFKDVDPQIGQTPCSAYGTSECPGAHQCTEDLVALAGMHKYCPHRYSETGVPLLEEQEESLTGVPLLEEQEEPPE